MALTNEQRIEALEKDVADLKTFIAALRNAVSGRPEGLGATATDEELDGRYGDPTIKYDPKDKYWNGPSFAGRRFSQCTPEYLDAMARYQDASAFMAKKGGEDAKANYRVKDASLARGWARRLRAGWKPPLPNVGGRPAVTPPAASPPSKAAPPPTSAQHDFDDYAGGFGAEDDSEIPF